MLSVQCRKALVLLNCLIAISSTDAMTKVYQAEIAYFGDQNIITGTIVAFAPHADDTKTTSYAVAYGGFLSGVPPNCEGCGFHFHTGLSCDSKETQEGHYFVDPVNIDPWNENTVYNSDANGDASFHGLVKIGTDDLLDHAVVVHAAGGARIGCGVLKAVAAADTLVSELTEFGASGASGSVTSYQLGSTDAICYYGAGAGLEKDLDTFAGVHIHSGVSCASKETQEGHYYNAEAYPVDPWNVLGYDVTDAEGKAEFAHCVKTGETEYAGKTFLIHSSSSSRLTCGVLAKPEETAKIEAGTAKPEEPATSGSVALSPFFVLQAIFAVVSVGITLSY